MLGMLAATLRLALAIAMAAPAPRAPATARTAAEPEVAVPLDGASAPGPGDEPPILGALEPAREDAAQPVEPPGAEPDAATQVVAPLSGGETGSVEPGPAPEISAPLDATSTRSAPIDAEREPVPHPEIQRPARRGVGMLAAGGTIGALGSIFMVFATLLAVSSAKDHDREDASEPSEYPDDSLGPDFHGTYAHIIATPLLIGSAGLLTAAMCSAGESDAYDDVATGRRYRRSANVMLGAGAGVLTLGAVTVATTLPLSQRADTHLRAAATREAGFWIGFAALLAGASMLGYGATYRFNRQTLDRELEVELSPLISRQALGVGVSGRF